MPNQTVNPLSLDAQVCFDLYSTSLAMTQLYKPLLESINLTYTQYLVMLILWQNNGLGLKDIAEKLFQKPGALTPVIKRMEKEGLLDRTRSKEDERNMEITLTPKGKRLKSDGLSINRCIVEQCGMDSHELLELSAKLKQLRSKLHKAN